MSAMTGYDHYDSSRLDYDLVVIGGGPKAAAIAAKTHVLNELGVASLNVLVVERDQLATNWTGRAGWTRGTEMLGTRPEKDVGFPYRSTPQFGAVGPHVDARLTAFSWHSHLVDTGRYQRWVDAGIPVPTHREFADYLKWVFSRAVSGVRVQRAEVHAVRYEADGWQLRCLGVGDAECIFTAVRGLVLTGAGMPNALPCDPGAAARVVTADMHRDTIRALPLTSGSHVCLVGAGESAASFALFLLDTFGEDIVLSIVTPTLPHSRAESAVENMVYSDPQTAAWRQLPESLREEFIRRTDRGVMSPAAVAVLARHSNISYTLGRVRFIGMSPTGRAKVVIDQPDEVVREECDLVVNCTGASPLTLVRQLLDEESTATVENQIGVSLTDRRALMREIDESLALRGLHPKLCIPSLAGLAQGPGFANLSSLGLLSDRVLGAYIAHPLDHTPLPVMSAAAVESADRF